MKIVSNEELKVLAEAEGWSDEHVRGYVDGEACRLRGKRPSKFVLVGIDQYCLGFRAGYFHRHSPEPTADLPGPPVAHQ